MLRHTFSGLSAHLQFPLPNQPPPPSCQPVTAKTTRGRKKKKKGMERKIKGRINPPGAKTLWPRAPWTLFANATLRHPLRKDGNPHLPSNPSSRNDNTPSSIVYTLPSLLSTPFLLYLFFFKLHVFLIHASLERAGDQLILGDHVHHPTPAGQTVAVDPG